MAWFTYECINHGVFRVSLNRREKKVPCTKCNLPSRVLLKVGTTVIYEKLDNGAMGRAVERIHNVEELMEERNDKSRASQSDESDE